MYAYGVNTNTNASTILKYNLQFFAEENDDDVVNVDNPNYNYDDNSSTDAAAFAEIISEKDKALKELQEEVNKLKKSNAELIVRVNAGSKDNESKTFEENLIALNGWKPRKE